MNVPDPVTTGVVIGTTLAAGKRIEEFISAIYGHPGESVGTMLGNMARRRVKNAEMVTEKAYFTLLNIGVKAKEVPLEVLQPLLESASLQEDTYLQDVWANLLANAANAENPYEVKASYVAIVKELSRREVKFLQTLLDLKTTSTDPQWAILKGLADLTDQALVRIFTHAGLSVSVDNSKPRSSFGELSPEERLNKHNFNEMLDILTRAGLMRMYVYAESVTTPDPARHVGGQIRGASKLPVKNNAVFRVSELGWSVIWSCQPPKKQEEP